MNTKLRAGILWIEVVNQFWINTNAISSIDPINEPKYEALDISMINGDKFALFNTTIKEFFKALEVK